MTPCIQKRKNDYITPPQKRSIFKVMEDAPKTTNDKFVDILSEEGRKQTYKNWKNHKISPDQLAKAGFYYSGRADLVICPFCGVEGFRWLQGDDPLADHIKWVEEQGKTCSFVESKTNNQTINNNNRETGRDVCGTQPPRYEENQELNYSLVNEIQISYPEYQHLSARIKSFENWPISLKQKPDELAECGLFYEGVGDRVICFYCGLGLKDWEETDVPWKEHAQWSPKCKYLLLKKDEELVQKQQNHASSTQLTSSSKDDILTPPKHDVNENRLCKICYKNEMQTVFTPCGHIFSCIDCSIVMKNCPLCRIPLTGFVRAYLP